MERNRNEMNPPPPGLAQSLYIIITTYIHSFSLDGQNKPGGHMPNVVPFTVRPIFKTIAYNMYRTKPQQKW